MRKAISAISALAGFAAFAWTWAQGQEIIGGNVFVPKSTVSYTGPGDVVAGATMWWGLRAYSAAKAGTKAAQLRRTADNATQDILTLTNGNFDVTSAAAFCTSQCFVAVLYDQTAGNNCTGASCDIVQTTAGNQPKYNNTCIGSLPCASAGTVAQGLSAANNVSAVALESMAWVGNRTVGTQASGGVGTSGPNGGNHTNTSGSNTWQLSGAAGNLTVAAADTSWHSSNGVFNYASSALNVDGTESSGAVSTSGTNAKPGAWQGNSSSTVSETEAGIWFNTGFTNTQRTNLCHNERIYWSTSGSC